MRRRAAIAILVASLGLGWGATSQAERVIKDGLEVSFNANFRPHALPRSRPAPVKIEISGRVAAVDGSHPPPLRRIEVNLNRNGRLYARGLPTCTAPVLQSTSTQTALSRCRRALVGRGSFRARVSLGGEIPTGGTILAFNGRREGKPALLLHFFAGVPVRFTLVAPLTIGHRKVGEFDTVLRAKIPKLGGDLGSITQIELTIGRRWSYRGKRRSYVSAACSALSGFQEATFPFARGSFHFAEHREFSEVLLRTCRVR